MFVGKNSSPLLFFKFFCLFYGFFYNIGLSCVSTFSILVWLIQVDIHIHLKNSREAFTSPLIHSTAPAVYLNQSPPFGLLYVRIKSAPLQQLWAVSWCIYCLSFMATSLLPIFLEPSSMVGVYW